METQLSGCRAPERRVHIASKSQVKTLTPLCLPRTLRIKVRTSCMWNILENTKLQKKTHTHTFQNSKRMKRKSKDRNAFLILRSYCWHKLINVVYSVAVDTHSSVFEVLLHLSTFIETSINTEGQRRHTAILILSLWSDKIHCVPTVGNFQTQSWFHQQLLLPFHLYILDLSFFDMQWKHTTKSGHSYSKCLLMWTFK